MALQVYEYEFNSKEKANQDRSHSDFIYFSSIFALSLSFFLSLWLSITFFVLFAIVSIAIWWPCSLFIEHFINRNEIEQCKQVSNMWHVWLFFIVIIAAVHAAALPLSTPLRRYASFDSHNLIGNCKIFSTRICNLYFHAYSAINEANAFTRLRIWVLARWTTFYC